VIGVSGELELTTTGLALEVVMEDISRPSILEQIRQRTACFNEHEGSLIHDLNELADGGPILPRTANIEPF
jgi:hypothetical protein